ncbi:mandelate racemase [Christiangramia fulva]|uniref:Mandelate racemase n=1 Tax=Christiangramia fulva TaxID=2126553 RepID=A0A2R3Z8L2_9FLAO|nr:enolase C-terminal domain-like protein [Christiangramia fulva]AVR46626.1 mandelate racemase [Christiangramia fulva]
MSTQTLNIEARLQKGTVRTYRIPTEEPESDGTLKWDHTDLILVELQAANKTGIGYSYASPAAAKIISDVLLSAMEDKDALDITGLWYLMQKKVRNFGRPGIAAMAISAVDNALWDLKAKVMEVPLCKLLGMLRKSITAYASGGFTSYDPQELKSKFEEWKEKGHHIFKMKIGRDKEQDYKRIEAARDCIGNSQLFVDANGAYFPKEAVAMGEVLKEFNVQWYEEPVTSDDLDGLHFVKEHVPAAIRVAAGEYGFTPTYFNRMLSSGSVDVLQADATRCGGITGFIKAHEICEAYHMPFSAHCAPSLHMHPGVALHNMQHIEYFRDHVRIESELFEGFVQATDGKMVPDLSRPGLGIEFKHANAKKYLIN